jgi:GNAT superfamily N-acetyltransferase
VIGKPAASKELLAGYRLRHGRPTEQSWLVAFMTQTYEEMHPSGSFEHLRETVEQFLSPEAPFWLVEADGIPHPLACLWLGRAIDQTSGRSHTHILLLYVNSAHRRQGIGSALLAHAEAWAKSHGEHQLGLQVFVHSQAAHKLYEQKGYACQSMWMTKPLAD